MQQILRKAGWTYRQTAMFQLQNQIPLRSGGIQPQEGGNWKFCWGRFFTGWWEPGEEWFSWFKPFSKLKTAFCEYCTSIKIKINMPCVYKEYEIKAKMVLEQWLQLKMKFLLLFSGEIFSGRGMSKFLVGE